MQSGFLHLVGGGSDTRRPCLGGLSVSSSGSFSFFVTRRVDASFYPTAFMGDVNNEPCLIVDI